MSDLFQACRWTKINCLRSFCAQHSSEEGVADFLAPRFPLPTKDTDAVIRFTQNQFCPPNLGSRQLGDSFR